MTTTALPQHQSWTNGSVRVTFDPRPTGGALVQIVINGERHGDFYTSLGEAQDTYDRLCAEHDAPLALGEQTVDSIDRTVVTVQRVSPFSFSVTCYTGTYRNDAWCYAYPTQTGADTARRATIAAFAAHGSADAIQARADEIAPQLWKAAAGRTPAAKATTKRLQTEAWALATLRRAGAARRHRPAHRRRLRRSTIMNQTVLVADIKSHRVLISIERMGTDQLGVSRYVDGQLVETRTDDHEDESTRDAARTLMVAGLLSNGFCHNPIR